MYDTQKKSIQPGTDKYQLTLDNKVISYARFINIMHENQTFRTFFGQVLAHSSYSAFRFETPALTVHNHHQPFEFVLVDSPWLQRPQDILPFSALFQNHQAQKVVRFDNLGGDATLIVPKPISEQANYAHFAAFLRTAPSSQIMCLFKTIAQTLTSKIAEKPIWFNTAGGGVDWLHVRLDSRPKYYAYHPYKLN